MVDYQKLIELLRNPYKEYFIKGNFRLVFLRLTQEDNKREFTITYRLGILKDTQLLYFIEVDYNAFEPINNLIINKMKDQMHKDY